MLKGVLKQDFAIQEFVHFNGPNSERERMRPLPKSPKEITPQWMTEVLRNSGSLPATAEVSKVAGRQLGEGAGMLSELSLLSLTYSGNHEGAPATLVAKFPTLNEVNRDIAINFCLLYTSPSPRDVEESRMPSSA